MLAGPVTVVPLICFGAAANRLPLSVVGLLQFLAPILQFLCGVLVQHESVPPARLAGFLIVWLALVLLTVDALRGARRRPARRSTGSNPLSPPPRPTARPASSTAP